MQQIPNRPEQGPDRSSIQGADRGSALDPARGPKPADGPVRLPAGALGPARGPKQGPERGPGYGPERGPGEGTERGNGNGAERGQRQGADRGAGQGAGSGPEQGAEQGSEHGRHRTLVSVALGDSNPLVLSALGEVFDQDARFSLVATSASAEGLLATVIRVPVDVAVVDWRLPSLGGARLIEVLRTQAQPPRVLVYGDDSADLPRIAMAAGAAGLVQRSADVDVLLSTCVDVAAGKMVFPFVDVRELQSDPIHSLSRMERATLEALARGHSNRELASELGISINTVKFHLSNLYSKLAVRNRAQAIAFYYARRLNESVNP